MKLMAAIAISLTLTACGGLPTKVTSTSPRTVVVQSFKGMQAAQTMANEECGKYGRLARWISGDVNYVFDCVN